MSAPRLCPYCQGGTFAGVDHDLEMMLHAAGAPWQHLWKRIKALEAENALLRTERSALAIRASHLTHFIALDSIASGGAKE